MSKSLAVFLALTVVALAQNRIDGFQPGQPAPTSGWKRTAKDTLRRGDTYLRVKKGHIESVWGKQLETEAGDIIRVGDPDQTALQKLGKPERTLHGCGQDSQQVRFFDSRHLEVTCTNGKVTGLRAYVKN